jgi:carbon monoxide dehydrogenase subunit G
MTKIDSKKATIAASQEDVFLFLSDMRNMEKILPLEKISNFTAQEDRCSFKVQNAYEISLILKEKIPHSQIQFVGGERVPFPLLLTVNLSSSESNTIAQLCCEAKLNPFLEMVAKGPLKNLFDYMADQLVMRFNSNASSNH